MIKKKITKNVCFLKKIKKNKKKNKKSYHFKSLCLSLYENRYARKKLIVN